MRPRVVIVSYYAANPLTPRGARSQAVARALSGTADVRVIAAAHRTGRRTWLQRGRDRALYDIGSRWLIDPQEPWSWRVLGRRELDADLALLVGYPFSPMVVAGRALRRHRIPYVLDLSDPWAATDPARLRDRSVKARRGRTLERRLWSGASAGIVTTTAQARDVLRLAPGLDVLVRPNGYAAVGAGPVPRRRAPDDELRIGHFGNLYEPRIAIAPFLQRLGASGFWRRIVIHQYGRDHHRVLRSLSGPVTAQTHDPVPWPEVVRLAAANVDLAVVIGNKDPRQLPSKAIEYLTLPVPRLAVTAHKTEDALSGYVDGKAGWLTVGVDDADAPARIRDHVRRRWTAKDLAAPPEESWEAVGRQLADFVLRRAAR